MSEPRPSISGAQPTSNSGPAAALLEGIRAGAPLLLGVLPFGMIYGVLATSAGIPPGAAMAMSSIVFAGSAQFVGAKLFSTGAPTIVILLTTFVLNLRHVLYSASIASYLNPLRPAWRWLLAYLLTDEAYVVAITHYQQAAAHRDLGPASDDRHVAPGGHWFFLGAGGALWVTWQASTAAGIFLGARVPQSWGLDFALPLTFIALVVPGLTGAPAIAAALTAGVVATVAIALPYNLGLVLASVAGILMGTVAEPRGPLGDSEPQTPGP